jgi:integrase/recombinase XerD
MTSLNEHVQDYLRTRRALGFKLERQGRLPADFAAFTARAGVDTVTIDIAVAWATLPEHVSPVWAGRRLSAVRGFARYLHAIDPDAEVPPTDVLPGRPRRSTPYLYSDADIAALMAAARTLRNPLKAATFEIFIGLLATCGLRGGEAMRLDRSDLDIDQGLLRIRGSKFGKSRQLVLHPTTVQALVDYDLRRDRFCRAPATDSLLISTTGARLCHATVQPIFRDLLRRAGIIRTAACRPRIHDLRHSFAVNTLLGWYRDGHDVQARIPALSTYLGHVDPGATYWYLTAAPELLALAAQRLETTFDPSAGRSS